VLVVHVVEWASLHVACSTEGCDAGAEQRGSAVHELGCGLLFSGWQQVVVLVLWHMLVNSSGTRSASALHVAQQCVILIMSRSFASHQLVVWAGSTKRA
jgi:hypothetical protein